MNDVALFAAAGLLLVIAGSRLVRYGDVIAAKSGLGRTWVGLLLVASITSLPELATGVSSAAQWIPDVAVGDVAGSCAFNLLLLAGADLLARRRDPAPPVDPAHATSAAFGIVGLAVVALSIAAPAAMPAVGWVGTPSLAIAVVYALALRSTLTRGPAGESVPGAESVPLRRAVLLYAANAAVVVLAGVILPPLAVRLADVTGLRQSFIGAAFVGAATSLPELVVTVAAMRAGAANLAYAGLLGSNLFDLFILAIDDVAYTPGPLLGAVGPEHLIPLVAAMAMSAVVVIGLGSGTRGRRWAMSGVVVLFVIQLMVMLRRA